MKSLKLATLLIPAVLCLQSRTAPAQAVPTATEGLHLSAFAAATGNFTGLAGGKNLSITAGVDFSLRPFRGIYPTLEARGTYPLNGGRISSQKNALGGIRFDHPIGRLRPYVNFLAGRGQIDYQNGGFTVGSLTYINTTSNVFSPGGGADIALSHHLSLKADYQFQLWKTPVTPSGSIYSNLVSLGAIYHFDFNRSYRSPHTLPPPANPLSVRY